jgi:8-oxo-dGTP pyrophosphatase MutT (NUDIX family)
MKSRPPVEQQTSAGGVVFRRTPSGVEVALISTGEKPRWQLPKGLVDPGESAEQTAVRECREETGLDAKLIAPLDVIEYWYQSSRSGQARRFHKRVHFFLLEYRSGEVTDHDHEVHEARWVSIESAPAMLAFPAERALVEKASGLVRTPA